MDPIEEPNSGILFATSCSQSVINNILLTDDKDLLDLFALFAKNQAEERADFEQTILHKEEIAMIKAIQPVSEGFQRNAFAVPDDAGQHTDDLILGYAAFNRNTIVSADFQDAAAGADDAMKNVLTRGALVKRNVVLARSSGRRFDHEDVSSLLDERHHAVTNVGVDDFAVEGELLLKGGIIIHL